MASRKDDGICFVIPLLFILYHPLEYHGNFRHTVNLLRRFWGDQPCQIRPYDKPVLFFFIMTRNLTVSMIISQYEEHH